MIIHHPNLSIQKALQLVGLTTEKLLPTTALILVAALSYHFAYRRENCSYSFLLNEKILISSVNN